MNNLIELAMDLAADGRTIDMLKQCHGNSDRLCVINNALLRRDAEYKFIIPNKPKNNKKSEEFRKLGNKLYTVNRLFDALECYNKSICFATKNSEQLAIAYANRSAVYSDLRQYELCLENISFAKKAGLPDRLMDKLNRRERDCLSLMKDGNENPNIYQAGKEEPKLSRNGHPQVPFIVDCLELKTNVNDGRHIVTNDDLKPGEIIAVEDAYVCGLYEDFSYRRCTYCTKENLFSLMPCDECTNTMFCPECANNSESNEEFHKFECPISYFLATFEKTRFVLRLVIRAVKSFPSFIDFDEFMKSSPDHTVFSFDQTKPLSAKQKYLQVHSLITNDEKESEAVMLYRHIYSTILQRNLYHHDMVASMLMLFKPNALRVIADIIVHCFKIIPQNGHILTSSDVKETEDIGGAVYPFASLLNHSCSPNIFRIYSGTKIVFVALRNIKKGEQLVDCYDKQYNSKYRNKASRQTSIEQNLHFECKCIACINDFPLGIHYKKKNIPPFEFKINDQSRGEDFKQQIENCGKYLEKYDNKYPCAEVDSAQEFLMRSISKLYGNVSAKCYF